MADANPYEILGVPRDAGIDRIEQSYDRLFDRYEPRAQAGDASAIAKLEALNEAREVLIDETRRSRLDVSLAKRRAGESLGRTGADVAGQATNARSSTRSTSKGTIRVRPRAARDDKSTVKSRRAPLMLLGISGGVIVVAAAVLVFILLNRGSAAGAPVMDEGNRGDVVATVNNQPVYSKDYDERVERDRQAALQDPLFAPFFNNFQGITGTRMLNILKSDSLDKLINLEVIMQQAKKEGLYPNAEQAVELIKQAKARDLQNGQSFQDFLKEKGITEAKYNRTVIQNVVYGVMADQKMPKTGTDDARTQAFINWICDTRKKYDVQIKLTFNAQNEPCTSGLPLDIPLPGLSQTPGPEPQATAAIPLQPGGTNGTAPAQSTPGLTPQSR